MGGLWGPSRCLLDLSASMRDFLNLKRLATTARTPRGSFGTVAVSALIFIAAFALFYPRIGLSIAVLGFIPILMAAWVYGIWAGVLFTFTLKVVEALIILLLNGGKFPIAILPGEILGLATGMLICLMMGWLGELSRENRERARQSTSLLEEAHQRAEKLAVLYAVAMAATESANEDQLIEHVTQIIGQRLSSDSFGILLLDESTRELYLHPSYRVGSQAGLARVAMGVGVTGTVAKTGNPLRVNDISASPDYASLLPQMRSELCVPLKVESKMYGVVNVESTLANAFTFEDEQLLTIIAGQLATAMQRLRTVLVERYQTQQLERANSLIRVLVQVNAHAAVASDPDGVLQTLGKELARLGLRCAITLSDTGSQHAILRYVSLPERLVRALEHISAFKMQNYVIPISKLAPFPDRPQDACLVKDSLAMLRNWAPDLTQRNATKILNLIGVTSTTSLCYLPLITEGKSMGALWMWGEGLHESDMPTMSLFTSQLAAALQNANLLTEVGRLAITDELTGIYNRRYFFEMAEKKFTRALKDKSPLSILLVDIDHFKNFNDRYGHAVGDQVLRAAAKMMASALRESDIIGRYGGEEFSIILPDTNNSSAIYVGERLLARVSDVPIDTAAGKLSIEISLGIAGMSKETPNLQSLIVRADQAMYMAKSAGRNRLAVK